MLGWVELVLRQGFKPWRCRKAQLFDSASLAIIFAHLELYIMIPQYLNSLQGVHNVALLDCSKHELQVCKW